MTVACRFWGHYRLADDLPGDLRLAQLAWYWDKDGSPLTSTEVNLDEHIEKVKRFKALVKDGNETSL